MQKLASVRNHALDVSAFAVECNVSVFNEDNALLKAVYKLFLVGNNNNGGTHLVDLDKKLHNLVGSCRIKVTRRLVCNYHSWVVNKRSCNNNSLLLATGKLIGTAHMFFFDADELQYAHDPFADLCLVVFTDNVHCVCNVLENSHSVYELKILIHNANCTAKGRNFAAFYVANGKTVYKSSTGRRLKLCRQQFSQGRFTRT